jgi:hypothetical protein
VAQAFAGYELANVVMIYGVIAIATGTRLRVHDLMSPTPPFEAWLIAVGAMLFLLGSAAFRLAMGIGPPLPRSLGALLPLAAVPAGIYLSAGAALTVVAMAITATLAIEYAVEKSARAPQGQPVTA